MRFSILSTALVTSLTLSQSVLAICPSFNYKAPLVDDPDLPNPFKLQNGAIVSNLEEWECRHSQLFDLFQQYEVGELPGKPQRFKSEFFKEESTLALTATEGKNTIQWNVTITYPNGTGPFPGIIVYGGPSIPIPDGIAVLIFNNDDIGLENDATSRGIGKFYDLYGVNATASAMTAWSWAISRILDAIDTNPHLNLDPSRIAVTGCSRNGKGALLAGAFDTRIALTIPQESGSGGSACWRLSDYMYANGTDTQTAMEIVGENVWFSLEFANFSHSVPWLPVDHHELAALVAPRGLLVIDNTAYDWLGPWSSYGCMTAGHLVYKALGVPDHMGFSQIGNHSHCVFPTDEQGPELLAYFQKFLLRDERANTTVFRTDVAAPFVLSEWVNWKVPDLTAWHI